MTAVLQERKAYDVQRIRRDFPILHRTIRGGKKLVYIDNAATTQKPQSVIDRIVRYYTEENSNVHRGVHYLSEVATAAYEASRTTVKRFLVELSDRGAVAALHVVVVNLQRRLRIDDGTLGQQQIAIHLPRIGLLCVGADDDRSVEDAA